MNTHPEMAPLPHEQLDCYRLAVEVALAVRGLRFPRREADLRNQALRASSSIVLNLSEGRSRRDGTRLYHFSIACGAAAEVSAVLDLLNPPQRAELQSKLRRIHWMARKLR